MKKSKIIGLIIIILLSIVMVSTFVYSYNHYSEKKDEINNSLSIEGINDEKIVNGILKEKERIEKEEYNKIWYPEIGILSVCAVSIVSILIINIIAKEGKGKDEHKKKSIF